MPRPNATVGHARACGWETRKGVAGDDGARGCGKGKRKGMLIFSISTCRDGFRLAIVVILQNGRKSTRPRGTNSPLVSVWGASTRCRAMAKKKKTVGAHGDDQRTGSTAKHAEMSAHVTKKMKKSGEKTKNSGAAAAAGASASNWSQLAKQINAGSNPKALKRKQERLALEEAKRSERIDGEGSGQHRHGGTVDASSPPKKPMPTGRNTALTDLVALDCEMVGVGVDGKKSILARVSVVNEDGNVVLDTFVSPTEYVVDYRTNVSGVRPSDLKAAPGFKEIQTKMAGILKGRILVGHALKNDLKCLLLDHPRSMTRDTALYRPLTRPLRPNERAQDSGIARGRGSRSLRELCFSHLGIQIQTGEHSSVDDARAALLLYKKNQIAWEREIRVSNVKSRGGKGEGKKQMGKMGKKIKRVDDGDDSDSDQNTNSKPSKPGKKHKSISVSTLHGIRTDPFAVGAPKVDLFRR